MNRRTMCNGVQHLDVEDIPGPNDTIDCTTIVDSRPCDCGPDQHGLTPAEWAYLRHAVSANLTRLINDATATREDRP